MPVAQQQLAELVDFISRERHHHASRRARRCRARRRRGSTAGRSPACGRRARSRRAPLRAFYYITDVDPSWPAERQDEHLRDFNYGALWAISIHEVFPGHFLHYQHLRQVESKLRKSILFSSTAFVEGWAHYCEQMMVERGLPQATITTVRLGQLAEALIRLCRCIVGIRLHCEDLSVEQGVRFFRDEAFLEEASARREAERGTFDPVYILYSAGKLMLLKLRDDYKAHVGAKYSLRGFHDTLLGNGTVPLWLHRALMLGEQNGEDDAGIQSRRAAMPLYEYECDACAHRFERIQKFSDPLVDACPKCGGPVRKLLSSPAIQFKGSGFYITDYAKKSSADGGTRRLEVGERRRRRRRRQSRAARSTSDSEVDDEVRVSRSRARRRHPTAGSTPAAKTESKRVAERLEGRRAALQHLVGSRMFEIDRRRYSRNGSARSGRRSAK